METMLDHFATSYNIDPIALREGNFLKTGDIMINGDPFVGQNNLPEMIMKLKSSSNFDSRKAAINKFNQVRNTLGVNWI